MPGADVDVLAGLQVHQLGAGHGPAGGRLQRLHLGAARGARAVGDGGADQGLDEAGVVDRGVPVPDGADRGVVPQVGEQPLHALAGQVPVDRAARAFRR